jgi:hypothetical protein
MRKNLLDRISLATLALALMLPISDCLAGSQAEPAEVPSYPASDRAVSSRPLPQIFSDVLPGIKAETHISILLPSHLVDPIAKAKHAVVEDASANGYAISLYYKLGVGDAGFAGSFSAQAEPKYKLGELANITRVKLAQGLRGFFRAVSCGGSCAPANLWWEQNGIVYQIQIKLPPSLSEQSQQKAIVTLADSSVIGGPR